MRNAIWVSFDLGVQGDYEGLYAWLDDHAAKECGDNLAYLQLEWQKDLLKELKSSLQTAISIKKNSRIYVLHLHPTTKKLKGTWLFGGRKAPPWAGFGISLQTNEDDEA